MIKFKKVSNFKDHENAVVSFFSTLSFGRFLSDPSLDRKKSLETEIENFKDYTNKASVFLAERHNEVVGLIGFALAEWDTEHFEVKTAKIAYFLIADEDQEKNSIAYSLLEYFENWAQHEQIRFVVTKLDTNYFTPVKALQQYGHILFECITQRKLEREDIGETGALFLNYRFAALEDMPELQKIAEENTFRKSHFYLDENLPVKKINQLYKKWIVNAFNSKSQIIVIEEEGKIAGAFIYRINDMTDSFGTKMATWEFAAVAPAFRNKGMGRKLFQSGIHACIMENVTSIDTTLVEKNIISQKLHENLGFKLLNTYYTFHKWL